MCVRGRIAVARPGLSIQVFVACGLVEWDGPPARRTSRTLHQVAYIYRTDAPGGFPYETTLWLFARLAHYRRREFTRELWLTLVWHDDPQLRPEVWSRRFQTATFRPEVPVRDVAAPVTGVFEGPGRYEFRLWHPAVSKWDNARRRRTLARTYIRQEG